MRRVLFAILAWVLLSAQTPMLPGFPPGTFQNRAALDSPAVAYQGPADIVVSPFAWWGLRAMSAAKAGTAAINLCDDAGNNCADISTNASTGILNAPGTLGGNNCAATGTCKIKTFYDQSGATNCTTACDMTNATNSRRANFIANCIGSLPCADFIAGSQTEYFTASNVTATNQPISISGVYLLGAAPVREILTDSSFNFQWAILNSTTVRMFAGTSRDTAITNNTSHIIQNVYNGASSDIQINATRTTLASPGTAGLGTVAANKLSIGSAGAGTSNLTAKMFELGVWNSAISSGNETSLCHNQFIYWGTATSC